MRSMPDEGDERDVEFELHEDGEGLEDQKPGTELGDTEAGDRGAAAAEEADEAASHRRRRGDEAKIPEASLAERARKARRGE